jgi:hypothetical protein
MLHRFVSGARQLLILQLIVAVLAIALAGWTLGVTNDLVRERERLRARVAQLEETLVANDVVVPSTTTVVASAQQRARDVYPPSISEGAHAAPVENSPFNPGQIITDLFTPPPPLRHVLLHTRTEADARAALAIAAALQEETPNIIVRVAPAPVRDQRQAGYAYYDGRQSASVAALMQRFHEIARRHDVAPWSAQLRGIAMPAQGEYAPDRLDIILPALPAPPSPEPLAAASPPAQPAAASPDR